MTIVPAIPAGLAATAAGEALRRTEIDLANARDSLASYERWVDEQRAEIELLEARASEYGAAIEVLGKGEANG